MNIDIDWQRLCGVVSPEVQHACIYLCKYIMYFLNSNNSLIEQCQRFTLIKRFHLFTAIPQSLCYPIVCALQINVAHLQSAHCIRSRVTQFPLYSVKAQRMLCCLPGTD